MIKLGLTGSIGMGKSTTAGFFADEGCAVWDADAAVHRLYSKGGAAVPELGAVFPEAIVDEAVSRDVLKQIILRDKTALARIEQIVHPLVGLDRQSFIDEAVSNILVFDIPLLFETGGSAAMDYTACVHVPFEVQKARVLERGTMTEADFLHILSKQMPIEEKLAKADFAIETLDRDTARARVREIVAQLGGAHA